MDCHVPVDDYCFASQGCDIGIPENTHSTDHFFIVFKVDTTYPNKGDLDQNQEEEGEKEVENDDEEEETDEEEEDLENGYIQVENREEFWTPCPRLEHDNLSKETISDMLSKVGVPLHKQNIMVDTISECADKIANSAYNKGIRVLPMLVTVSAIACWCYYEQVSAADQKIQTGDGRH